jgi:hypothetical protein
MITTTDEFTYSNSANVQDVLDDLDQAIANVNAKDPVLTLTGDVTGSATFTNLGNATLTATVADDSHNHIISNIDGLQAALDGKVDDSQVLTNVPAGAVFTDTVYTHPTYAGDDISANFGTLSGAQVINQLTFNVTTDGLGHVTDANLNAGTRNLQLSDLGYTGATNANYYTHPSYAGDDINLDTGALTGATVISDLDFNVTTDTLGHVTDANATYSTRNITYSDVGAAAASHTHNYISEGGTTFNGTYPVAVRVSANNFYSDADITFTGSTSILNTTGGYTVGGTNTVFHDGYHPNADKWTTARTLTLNGDVSGSVSWDGSGNATLTTTVADDSHNHTIANVDGLQSALDGKQPAGTYNTIIGTDSDINTSGSTIIDNIYVTDGVITSMGTRTLTASDIGAAPTSHTHSYLPLSGGNLSGSLDVAGNITIDGTIESSGLYHQWNVKSYYGNVALLSGKTAQVGIAFDLGAKAVCPQDEFYTLSGSDNDVDLGKPSARWKDLYISGSISDGTSSASVAGIAKAWVTFNQTGTQSILQSNGVSSISDLGTGITRINLSTSAPHAEYAIVGNTTHNLTSTRNTALWDLYAGATSSNFTMQSMNASGTAQDRIRCWFAIYH